MVQGKAVPFEGKHSEVTGRVLESFYKVYNCLGYGFSEKVYENALALEMTQQGMKVEPQKPIQVFYQDHVVGEYFADMLVNERVILEIKSARSLTTEHQAQLLNYLKATRIEVGLLLNFGPKAQFTRKVYDNERKGLLSWVEK